MFVCLFVCNAITKKCLHQSHPKYQGMFISPRVIFGNFLGNLGFHVLGVGPTPQKSATSDFDEIYNIYINLTEEHNGLAPESLSGHLRGRGGGAPAPFQILKKSGFRVMPVSYTHLTLPTKA